MPSMTARPPLILGSTSRYRRDLLERLRLPFDVQVPAVDETPRPDEPANTLALRLALAKAGEVATRFPGASSSGPIRSRTSTARRSASRAATSAPWSSCAR
jgi:predicted house-cleaning NTP pyrophosphatase (Maf/HAM1 superfamily)